MSHIMKNYIDDVDIEHQLFQQAMDITYEFNLMLVGTTGIGKSSLVTSLLQGEIKPESDITERKLNEYSKLLIEDGVKLHLCCIETSNYDEHDSKEYKQYIVDQLQKYFVERMRKSPQDIRDTRVNCCLYLIPPHPKMVLHKKDIDCMLELHDYVNLVPVIARADSFSPAQLNKFKENVLLELEKNGVKYYKFFFDEKEDEELSKTVDKLSKRFPFAIVTADEPTIIDGKPRWIRPTQTGPFDIRDRTKCDFDALANLIFRHCTLNLIDSTHDGHYKNYRTGVLAEAVATNNRNLREMGLVRREIERIEKLVELIRHRRGARVEESC